MRKFSLGAIFASLALFIACSTGGSQSNTPQVSLSTIAVSGQNASLVAGQAQQMTATGTFSDKSSHDLTSTAQWNSSDNSVATVSSSGMVTAKAAGKCSITATSSGVTGTFSLTVTPALVSIAVTPATTTIAPQTNQQFIATGTFSDNSTQNITGSVTWTSSNTAAATIGSSSPTQGLAHGVAGGSTTITATSGAISGTASLTVTNAAATSLSVSPANPSLPLGLALQFTATATFSDGSSQNVSDVVSWSSSANSVASITVSGLATGKNVGTTTISASFESVSGNTTLTVNSANLVSIAIQPNNSSGATGINVFFTATGTFNDGGTRNITQQVTWSSSNTAVLTVGGSSGVGLTVSPGMVTVTATLGAVSTSTSYTVTSAKIVSISMTPATGTIPTGGSIHFSATGVFDDSSTADVTAQSVWKSSDTTVATVGSSSGSFGTTVGVSQGNATITATFTANGQTATGSVPLTVTSATLSSLSLTPASDLIAPGTVVQYNATAKFSDGSTEFYNQFVTWTSSNTKIATVTAGGAATGQSSGTATITAQAGAISASASLVVESSTLSSVQITPASSNDPVTIQIPFTAIGTFANGDKQDLTQAATWTSQFPSIATVGNSLSNGGVATGIEPGTTTISAAFGGQVGTATLTVTNATLTSIAVTPSNASIPLGTSQQMTATGTFSDGSSLNITGQVSWTSSDPGVATINQFGNASSVASGTSTLKASLEGVSGTAILTVQ